MNALQDKKIKCILKPLEPYDDAEEDSNLVFHVRQNEKEKAGSAAYFQMRSYNENFIFCPAFRLETLDKVESKTFDC